MPVPSHIVYVSFRSSPKDRVTALRAYDRQEAEDLAAAAHAWVASAQVEARVEVVPVRLYVRPDRLAAGLAAELAADLAADLTAAAVGALRSSAA